MQIQHSLLLAAAIVSASLLAGATLGWGRFALIGNDRGFAYRVDKLTGNVSLCTPQGCRELPELPFGLDLSQLEGQ